MIVDVSRKPDVYRYAVASAEVAAERCNTSVAARAALQAYRYLPFLHPLPLRASAGCRGGKLYVEGAAEWQTGVEMDVLFGALVGSVASGIETIRNLSVDVKKKGEAPPDLSAGPLQETPFARGGDLETSAYGEMVLRNVELAKGPVEKGHPIYAAQTAAALNAKRLCELLGGPCPSIQHFKIDIEAGSRVEATATVKARDMSPAPEALFAVGVALLTIWDMVKKWEKDEMGQYPATKIAVITLRG
ncbi:cyclic pyranopterin monophosphate synthase MoaC [Pyrobaculum neutrophilum]|uniref:Molybdopterin cofactor biosynthesis protein with MoaC region n=1 Tax=Pyrobaculum neutrophilum (strain DSM 2338 / JCM 9278 / NBRC 100436 / V24Sta) TaxID=444157 RepID=B1YA30_PYRNV|nr:cyclic pyranopterin monophosphate synthase MoaC [Pyrobaculum neutrophilum]ACB39004.1 molybdopterin cofactor biosynthesis protein with MoaC region [Pyrobaculum neutrophilum V24Sta]